MFVLPLFLLPRKRAASLSRYDALKLDSGVTGMEILSGSRDLLSLPERMLLVVATQLTQELFQAQRRWRPRPMRHEQVITDNLRILQLLALRFL
jgi:hypothetical protein